MRNILFVEDPTAFHGMHGIVIGIEPEAARASVRDGRQRRVIGGVAPVVSGSAEVAVNGCIRYSAGVEQPQGGDRIGINAGRTARDAEEAQFRQADTTAAEVVGDGDTIVAVPVGIAQKRIQRNAPCGGAGGSR